MIIPEVGTEIKIIDACRGSYCFNDCVGIITDEIATGGLYNKDEGFNIKITQGYYKDKIARISLQAEFMIISVWCYTI